MPIATPMIPDSLIGASKQRDLPYLRCSPSVQRKTPPKQPTSSPNTTTLLSSAILQSIASRIASTIDMRGMALNSELLALLAQMTRHLLVDLLEHRRRARLRAVVEGAGALGLLRGVENFCVALRLHLSVALLAPGADADEMDFQPLDRIAQRPRGPLVLGAIFRRIVRGRMRARAVGYPFDQRRAQIGARPFGRPDRDRMDGKIVVAVDAQRRNAEAVSASSESGALAPRDALIGRDRPLVVDDIENDRRPIDRGEHQRRMEIAFRCRPFADPA